MLLWDARRPKPFASFQGGETHPTERFHIISIKKIQEFLARIFVVLQTGIGKYSFILLLQEWGDLC